MALCDTVSVDTYWHGSLMSEAIETWTAVLERRRPPAIARTQMEDNATMTALRRGADAGRLDFDRVAVLRTASNFDREPPGKTALDR